MKTITLAPFFGSSFEIMHHGISVSVQPIDQSEKPPACPPSDESTKPSAQVIPEPSEGRQQPIHFIPLPFYYIRPAGLELTLMQSLSSALAQSFSDMRTIANEFRASFAESNENHVRRLVIHLQDRQIDLEELIGIFSDLDDSVEVTILIGEPNGG